MPITFMYPMYRDNMRPEGFLTDDKRCHALFHYYIMCQKLLEKAMKDSRDQIVYSDSLWMDKPYGNIATGTAIRYGLDNPGEFLHPHWKEMVESEIMRLGWPKPDPEYWTVEPGKVVLT